MRQKEREVTINKLARTIALKEGKKSQARMGDVREILAILSDIYFEEVTAMGFYIDTKAVGIDVLLYLAGEKRAKRKAKKAKKR